MAFHVSCNNLLYELNLVRICMAHGAIPMIAFHGVESIIIYIYTLFILLCHIHVVYIVKEVASFQGAESINECGV